MDGGSEVAIVGCVWWCFGAEFWSCGRFLGEPRRDGDGRVRG